MRFRATLALAVVLAACGGGAAATGDSVASLQEGSATTSTTVADPEAAAIAFTECMRENGIEMEDPTVDADGNVLPGRPTDLPEPGAGGSGGDTAPITDDLGRAFEECGELLDGTAFGFTPEDQSEIEDQLLELAACLREQGLQVADPDFDSPPDVISGEGDGEVRASGPLGLDFQDPEVQAALEECEEFAPNFQGGPGGGQGPGVVVSPPGGGQTGGDQ